MFLAFIGDELPVLIENVPLLVRQRMWLQVDGVPAHFDVHVRNELNILIGGYLTCLDFFLWGYVKDQVYSIPPTTPENMKERIRTSFLSITPRMLENVKRSFLSKVQMCFDHGGNHVEHL